MRFLHWAWVLGITFLLTGCAAQTPVTNIPTLTSVVIPQKTEVVRTMVPEPTGTAAPTTAAATPAETQTGAAAETAYPVATLAAASGTAYPAQNAYPYPAPGATPQALLGGQIAPFQDCARTPGLTGCDPKSAPLAGRLAFADSTAKRLVTLDLQTGKGWQMPLQPAWLDWSPDGQKLLAAVGEANYTVLSAAGEPVETFTGPLPGDSLPAWQPDGTLSKDGTVRSSKGDAARLEYTQDMTWMLHVKPAQGQETVVPVEAQSTDRIYQLVGWEPGTAKLLLQRYFASNSATLIGGEVLVIDTAAGTLQTLNVKAPLGYSAAFAWAPRPADQPGLLAFIASGGQKTGDRWLALYDFKTGQMSTPLPQGVNITGLAWQPDGQRLTVAALPDPESVSADTQKIFPGAGIYQLDPQTGKVDPLVASPAGAQDGWPHWTTDGQALIYARSIDLTGSGQMTQIRARRVDNQQDWVLVDGLPGLGDSAGQVMWQRVLAFGRR